MAENVFEGVSYYLAEKNVHEPAEVIMNGQAFVLMLITFSTMNCV